MVTLKWTKDAQGCPVSTWAAEEPTTAEATQFGTSYHKAVRSSLKARASARRSVRTLTTLAAAALVE